MPDVFFQVSPKMAINSKGPHTGFLQMHFCCNILLPVFCDSLISRVVPTLKCVPTSYVKIKDTMYMEKTREISTVLNLLNMDFT